MHERDRKIFKKVMAGRQNVHFYLKWAAMLPRLRTTDLNHIGNRDHLLQIDNIERRFCVTTYSGLFRFEYFIQNHTLIGKLHYKYKNQE